MARRPLPVALAVFVAGVLAVACAGPGGPPSLVVGATADPQDTLLAQIYAAGLRYYGTAARVEASGDVLDDLGAGTIGVAPGFTGRLLQRLDPLSQARSAEQVYRALAGSLPEGVAAADYAVAAEDKPALAVTDAVASRWGGELAELVSHCSGLRIGALTGTTNPGRVGSCVLPGSQDFGYRTTLFDALRTGAITAAWASTADPALPEGVALLADRKPVLIPAQNVVALYRRNEMSATQLRAVNEIAGVLDTASLIAMQREVQGGADPEAVAEEWLAANPLGR